MGILKQVLGPMVENMRDPINKKEDPEYAELLTYLKRKDVDGAISFKIDRRFSDEKFAKSPALREAVKKLLLDLFDPKEQHLDSLTLEKAIRLKKNFLEKTDSDFFKQSQFVFPLKMFILRNLKNGTFDSLKSAVDAKDEFGVDKFDGTNDLVFQKAVLEGLHFNMLNDDRLCENHIEKIKNNFLLGQEHLLRKAASLAVEKLRNPSSLTAEGLLNSKDSKKIEARLEEIQVKYLQSDSQSNNRQVA